MPQGIYEHTSPHCFPSATAFLDLAARAPTMVARPTGHGLLSHDARVSDARELMYNVICRFPMAVWTLIFVGLMPAYGALEVRPMFF